MSPADKLWPALLEIHRLGRSETSGESLGWRLAPTASGPWSATVLEGPVEWMARDDEITCDLTRPMPSEVASKIGFFSRYLELLWRQRALRQQRTEESGHLYVTACFAQSLDGFIATANGDSQWIGNEENLIHAHRMRALHDAILVGCRTYLNDKPKLTVRHVEGEHPFRVVITRQSGPSDELIAAITQPTLVIRPGAETRTHEEGQTLQLATAESSIDGRYVCPKQILKILRGLGLRSVLIEGGGVTVSLFKQHNLLDQADIQIAPLFLGAGIRPLAVDAAASVADAVFHTASVSALGDQSLMSLHFS